MAAIVEIGVLPLGLGTPVLVRGDLEKKSSQHSHSIRIVRISVAHTSISPKASVSMRVAED